MKEETAFENIQLDYGAIALGQIDGCCESETCCEEDQEILSLGCFSQLVDRANIQEGMTVLDLGCGPGKDVLAAAAKVGDTGLVYGLDMTKEMLDLARQNTKDHHNIEIIEGNLQDIPLPDSTVDIIISNCVFNLALDKSKAFAEAYRVLKPGGRIVESDVALEIELSEEERNLPQVYCGCIGGAISENDYIKYMRNIGFVKSKTEKLHSSTYKLAGKDYPYNSVLFTGYKSIADKS